MFCCFVTATYTITFISITKYSQIYFLWKYAKQNHSRFNTGRFDKMAIRIDRADLTWIKTRETVNHAIEYVDVFLFVIQNQLIRCRKILECIYICRFYSYSVWQWHGIFLYACYDPYSNGLWNETMIWISNSSFLCNDYYLICRACELLFCPDFFIVITCKSKLFVIKDY